MKLELFLNEMAIRKFVSKEDFEKWLKNAKARDISTVGKIKREFFDYKKGLEGLIKKDKDGYYIYNAGKYWEQFDFKKGLEELIKKDKAGLIYSAGKYWKQFDCKRGLEELIKKDKGSYYIYLAGFNWKQFNFKKGFEELIKKDKTGYYIYSAGLDWKQFDFKKGFEELIKKNKNGYYIYSAGLDWKQFNFKKGFDALKNTEYYKKALKDWPKGIKEVEKISKEIKDTAAKLPKKSLKLESVLNEEITKEEMKETLLKKKIPGLKIGRFSPYGKHPAYNVYYKKKQFKVIKFKGNNDFIVFALSPSVKGEEAHKLENLLNTLSKDDAIKKIKEIKNTATKLPKKKLKLER